MTHEEIVNKVKDIIVDKNDLDPKEVTDNAHFENDLGMDSLDRVELVMEIEKEFKISVPDAEAEKAYTLNDCVEIVDAAQHGKS